MSVLIRGQLELVQSIEQRGFAVIEEVVDEEWSSWLIAAIESALSTLTPALSRRRRGSE